MHMYMGLYIGTLLQEFIALPCTAEACPCQSRAADVTLYETLLLLTRQVVCRVVRQVQGNARSEGVRSTNGAHCFSGF